MSTCLHFKPFVLRVGLAVVAGLASALPAAAESVVVNGKVHVFAAPAGLCFLDMASRDGDAVAAASLAPASERYVLAAAFADCAELDAWRADPRLRVVRWGTVLLDRRYVGDARLAVPSAAAGDQVLRGLEGLGADAGALPAARSPFAAYDGLREATPAGWSSWRGGLRLGALAARVSVDGATREVSLVHGSMFFGGTVLELTLVGRPADLAGAAASTVARDVATADPAADTGASDLVRLAGAMRGALVSASVASEGPPTRWQAPPAPTAQEGAAAPETTRAEAPRQSAVVALQHAASVVLVAPERREASLLAPLDAVSTSVLAMPERRKVAVFADPAARPEPPHQAGNPVPAPGPKAAPPLTSGAPPEESRRPAAAPDIPAAADVVKDAIDAAGPPAGPGDVPSLRPSAEPDVPAPEGAARLPLEAASENHGDIFGVSLSDGTLPAFGEAAQTLDFATFDLRAGETDRP